MSERKPTSHEAALMRAFKLKSLGELRQLLGTRIRDLSPEEQRYLARCGLTSHGPEQPSQ